MKNFQFQYMWKALGIAVIPLMLGACSDRNDYNDVPTDITISANQTVWKNIQANANLSDFAALIKKAHFDDDLQSSKFYTVWAPVNGSYDAQALMSEDSTMVLKQFVKNHIANYNHKISGTTSERVTTLNSKSYLFQSDGTASTFGSIALSQMNLPSSNGMMHLLTGANPFYPNIYEYITESNTLDSVKNYYQHFANTYLDVNNSVLGPVVNGKQTYIDSVMITTNSLFSRLNAYISREDSNYTALLPTNEAYVKAYNRIRPYFTYAAKTAAQDLSVTNLTPTITRNLNAAYFSDSLTRNAILSHMFINNNNAYNSWVYGGDETYKDTLLTTGGTALSNGEEILSHAIQTVTMSNGKAKILDTLAFMPGETWVPILHQDVLKSPRVLTATATTKYADVTDVTTGKTTTLHYVDFVPSGSRAFPDVFFYLRNTLSTTYNMYVVVLPPTIDPTFEGTALPNKFSATLTYSDANGTLKTKSLGTAFTNNPAVIDTVFIGEMTFPVAYRGIGAYYPTLEIKSSVRIFNKEEMASYDREMRFNEILLCPKELDTIKKTE